MIRKQSKYLMAEVVRFAGISSPNVITYAVEDLNGTTLHVFNAKRIRVLSEGLRVRYDVVAGNTSEIFDLIKRSEADIIPTAFSQAAFISKEINFSYPSLVSDFSFMTNKPEPVSKSLAILHPFSYSMWIALAVVLITVPLLFYILMNRKVKYLNILFDVFGYLLEQSLSFEVGRNNTRVLLTSWLLGAMIISYGYKAVLLSSLTFPSTTVIRDIPDLVKAISEDSVKCFAMPGTSTRDYADSETLRAVMSCLERNKDSSSFEKFHRITSKKIFFNDRTGLSYDEKDYFISEDSFYYDVYAYPVSKNFCCLKKLNKLIHRIEASGILKKIVEEEKFFWRQHVKPMKQNDTALDEPSRKLSFSDISGAFFILLSGWCLALLMLIGEIFMQKCSNQNL